MGSSRKTVLFCLLLIDTQTVMCLTNTGPMTDLWPFGIIFFLKVTYFNKVNILRLLSFIVNSLRNYLVRFFKAVCSSKEG